MKEDRGFKEKQAELNKKVEHLSEKERSLFD